MSMIQPPNAFNGEEDDLDKASFLEGRKVAQLPVTNQSPILETNNQTTMFSRSISMPLPETNSVNQASSENITAKGIPHSDSNSGEIKSTAIAEIENIKLWSISIYKCTKQVLLFNIHPSPLHNMLHFINIDLIICLFFIT